MLGTITIYRRVTRLLGRSATLPVEDLRNRRDLCVDSPYIYIYTPFVVWTYHYILCVYHYISCFFFTIYIYNLIILISAQWVSSIHRSEQIVGLMIIIYPKLHQHQRQKMGGDFLEDEASNSLGVVVWFKECALVIFYATVGIGDSSHEGGSWSSILHSKISHIPGQTSP